MTPAHWKPMHLEEYEERAAIKEYLGGMSRIQAEQEAWEEIERKYFPLGKLF